MHVFQKFPLQLWKTANVSEKFKDRIKLVLCPYLYRCYVTLASKIYDIFHALSLILLFICYAEWRNINYTLTTPAESCGKTGKMSAA